MQISITIPDNKASDVIDALAALGGWDSSNPLTKPQFAKKMLIDYVKSSYIRHEATQAGNIASAASIAQTQLIEIT